MLLPESLSSFVYSFTTEFLSNPIKLLTHHLRTKESYLFVMNKEGLFPLSVIPGNFLLALASL